MCIKKMTGSSERPPKKNLVTKNNRGPMSSMAELCTTKVVPQMRAVISNMMLPLVFLFIEIT